MLESVTFRSGQRAVWIEGLSVEAPGAVSVTLLDPAGEVVAKTNQLIVEDTRLVHFWGDIHGESDETIGTGSARDYFAFVRDLASVDACAHQGNDFQITDAFWDELGRLTREFDEPGRFVALPGYEWSGNTALGGDRNVLFPEEGRTIRRSSHALTEDRATAHHDCTTAAELFEAFARSGESGVVCFAHCGGRYADSEMAYNRRFERSVEVHSSWGTFEWLLDDALRHGYRVCVVANSDGHKGRPGASYPGAGKFGAIGGLTCYLMERLDRAALLDCLRKRRHYGTTGGPGGRPVVDLVARLSGPAMLYHDDPAVGPAEGRRASEALMGDILHMPEGELTLEVAITANSPIDRVDIYNGRELVETVRPHGKDDLGARIRVIWEGAEYRGRFREVVWDGRARFRGNSLLDARPVNFLNRDKTLDRVGNDALAWRALTTGNFGGFEVVLADPREGSLILETPLVWFPAGHRRYRAGRPRLRCLRRAAPLRPGIPAARLEPAPRDHLQRAIPLRTAGDNAIYIRLTQEEGTRAWTSPVYLFR